MLNGLDICAGSGIGSAAFEACGFARTVCYVERDPYCARLLECRMRSGDLDPAPVWDDLRTFDGRPWAGVVDFVFGGIPCQPYSVAGKQLGEADERDLWPDFRRVLGEIRPRVALIENVSGFLAHGGGLQRVLGELAEDGWNAEWATLGAWEVGANHRRDRVWVVAYPGGERRQQVTGSSPRHEATHEGRAALPDHEPAVSCEGGPSPDAPRRGQRAGGRAPGDAGQSDERGEAAADACREQSGAGRPKGPEAGEEVGVGGTATAAFPERLGRDGRAHEQGQQAAQRGWAEECPAADAQELGPSHRYGRTVRDRAAEEQPQRCHDGGPGQADWCPQPGLRDLDDGLADPLAALACADWWASWPPGPGIPPLATGVPERTDKLRTLGNGWVPHVAAYIAGRIQAWMDGESEA